MEERTHQAASSVNTSSNGRGYGTGYKTDAQGNIHHSRVTETDENDIVNGATKPRTLPRVPGSPEVKRSTHGLQLQIAFSRNIRTAVTERLLPQWKEESTSFYQNMERKATSIKAWNHSLTLLVKKIARRRRSSRRSSMHTSQAVRMMRGVLSFVPITPGSAQRLSLPGLGFTSYQATEKMPRDARKLSGIP